MSLNDVYLKTEDYVSQIYDEVEKKKEVESLPEQKSLKNLINVIKNDWREEARYVWEKYSNYTVDPNLKVLMHFDKSKELRAQNSAGYKSGTFIENGTVSADEITDDHCSGVVNDAISFHTRGYVLIDISSTDYVFNGDFSIGFWVDLSSLYEGSEESILTHGFYEEDLGLRIYRSSSNEVVAYLETGNNPYGIQLQSPALTGRWHHVLLQRHEDTYSLYVDGAQVSSIQDSSNITSISEYIVLGARIDRARETQYDLFNGAIDEFFITQEAIWPENSALSPFEEEMPIRTGTGSFSGYVFSNNINTYPDEDFDGEYYYQLVRKFI